MEQDNVIPILSLWLVRNKHNIILRVYPQPLLSATKKNLLPVHHHNNDIYQFVRHCDSRYVKPWSQRLQERIKQHFPWPIKNHHSSQDRSNLSCACKMNSTSQIIVHDSAIKQYLLQKLLRASKYSDAKFSILTRRQTS